MNQITLEFNNDQDLLQLLDWLRQFDVRIVRQTTKRAKKQHPAADFYQQFNLNLSQFKFNRDEANER